LKNHCIILCTESVSMTNCRIGSISKSRQRPLILILLQMHCILKLSSGGGLQPKSYGWAICRQSAVLPRQRKDAAARCRHWFFTLKKTLFKFRCPRPKLIGCSPFYEKRRFQTQNC